MLNTTPSVSVILVEPQMGENIGAVARTMKNFSLSDLRIVNPRDGWPNEKAISVAVSAVDIIVNARLFSSLPAALYDLEYVYATTAMNRSVNKEHISSRNLVNDIPTQRKIGLVFGRENCGLRNDELVYANKILTIETDNKLNSLNISHAVTIICYELFGLHNNNRSIAQQTNIQSSPYSIEHSTAHDRLSTISNKRQEKQQIAKYAEIECFYQHLFTVLTNHNFFRINAKKRHMSQKIRNLFNRIDGLSHSELKILWGIVNSLSAKKDSAHN